MKLKNGRTVLLSVMVITLCMMLLVTGTYALFTDTAKISNHLQARNLNLKLERVGLEGNTLNAKGELETKTYTASEAYHHYTDGDETDVFDAKNLLVAPGFYREATLRLSHEKFNADEGLSEEAYKTKYGEESGVAYKYWLELRLDSAKNEELDWQALASQLMITVSQKAADGSETYTKLSMKAHSESKDEAGQELALYKVDNQICILIGDPTNPVGSIGVGGSDTFKVKVEFKNFDIQYDVDAGTLSSQNNVAQNQEVWFDLVVYAVQVVSLPSEG